MTLQTHSPVLPWTRRMLSIHRRLLKHIKVIEYHILPRYTCSFSRHVYCHVLTKALGRVLCSLPSFRLAVYTSRRIRNKLKLSTTTLHFRQPTLAFRSIDMISGQGSLGTFHQDTLSSRSYFQKIAAVVEMWWWRLGVQSFV